MAGKSLKPGSGGFDPSENVNSNTLKRHPKMDLSRNDLLQLLSYLEGELQARDVAIATLKAEKAKQLLYQAKYGRFGLGDPFSAMQRDSDNMKDNSFDESAIKCMYDNQLAQLENLIATQRKAQMKMREQMITSDKRYQKVCSELDEEKRKHAQDTAQGDDVTYMLEKERERLKQEVEFEKANVKKMEKDLKKTLASLEEERVNSGKHKQVALMLIKERKKLVEKYVMEKHNAEEAEKLLTDERTKAMNMAEGLVQESKKSLKMEATMERQLSEFDLEREQMRNKLLREENRNKDLQSQVESLKQQVDNLQKQLGKSPKDSYHSVEIKSQIASPQVRLSSERTAVLNVTPQSTHLGKLSNDANVIEREAGLSPRNSPSDLSVRKRDTRYASPQPSSVDRGAVHYHDSSLETRVAPVGAISDRNVVDPHSLNKLNISVTGSQPGPTVVSGGGRITVQTGSPTPGSGPVSPRRVLAIGRGVPPPIPPNKPVLSVTSANTKPVTQKIVTSSAKENRVALTPSGSKPVHIPVSVVHTSTFNTTAGGRTTKRDGSPSSIRKPAQFTASLPLPATASDSFDASSTLSNSDSFDFLGPEMADLQQLLVSMVSVSPNSTSVETETTTAHSDSISTTSTHILSSSSYSLSMPNSKSKTSTTLEINNSLVSSTSNSYTFSTIVSAQSVSSNALVLSNASNEHSNSVCPVLSTVSASQLSSTNVSVSMSSLSSSSATAALVFSQVSSSESLNSNSFTTPFSFSLLPSTLSPSTELATISSGPLISQSSNNSFTLNSSPIPFSKPFSTSTPPSSLSSSSLNSAKSPLQSSLKEDTSNFILPKPSNRDERGLTPPTSCQTATEAWTSNQHGNKDLPFSPIHRYAYSGNTEALRKLIIDLDADVNLPMKDGTTPCHCAAENGHLDCLKLLMSRGGNINCIRDDQLTPVHCAAAQGHSQCLYLLLTHGGQCHNTDQSLWTPLHWAAASGHVECCQILVRRGAKRTALSCTNWTPCHMAVQYDHVDCLDLLLTFESEKSDKLNDVKGEITQIVDKDGWTLAHLAASKDSSECLSVILANCDIDLHCQDKLGRTVLDVASTSTHGVLISHAKDGQTKHIPVEMICTGSTYQQQQPYTIGHASIHCNMDWSDLYRHVTHICVSYFSQIDRGLHSKKISRLDPENNLDTGYASLGLDEDSIYSIDLGSFSFNSDTTAFPQYSPFEILINNNICSVCVKLKGFGGACSSLAFDLLMPVSTISNYMRLLEQYHSVIFYGPEGTRKKQLVKRLSHHLASKEEHMNRGVKVLPVYLHQDFTQRDFIQLLKENGCLIPSDCSTNILCIVMLFHLEKVNFATMFGTLLQHIDHRGGQSVFYLSGVDNIQEAYYLSEYFYLIATMDKPRSIGLDLSIQQRFRWVNFCVNVEPIRNLLARHLLRRLIHAYGGELPNSDDPVYKAVEWLVCVWQRLNDGVNKLGLPDVVFGPEIFLPCPLETKQPESLFEWMKKLWNEVISSAVKTAIIKVKESDGQGKVTNTALYVLLQRVIVPGCPLTGKEDHGKSDQHHGKIMEISWNFVEEEKDEYLKDFHGSNELDIPLYKSDKSPNIPGLSQRRPLYDSKRQADDEAAPAKTKHRNSIEGDGRFLFTKTVTASPNPKRRSLSDTYLTKTENAKEIPVIHQQSESNNFYSKVPKLEIRSPVLGLTVPLPSHMKNDAGTNPLTNLTNSNEAPPTRRSTSSTHSRIPTSISKRSRSSEGVTRSQVQGRSSPFRPTSPFSFSLTTPTSSLFSFKFLDNNNSGEVSKQSVFNSARESQC